MPIQPANPSAPASMPPAPKQEAAIAAISAIESAQPPPTPTATPAASVSGAVAVPTTPSPTTKKKSFFLFSLGKKKSATPTPKKKKGGVGAFFTSLNNIGMGKQRIIFVQNMAMMLGAGLSILAALKTLALETRNRAMRKVIKHISEEVESGIPLWKAMDDQYLFSPYEIALIRIGEEAGHLARNMEYLSQQQEKDMSLRQKVKIAMIYPSIVLTLVFLVVMGLGLFVLPSLIQVLVSLNADLPITTRILIAFTNIFQDNAVIIVPGVIGGFMLIFLLGRYTSFRIVTQWIVFHIPGIGSLAKEATIARFGVILGGLLQAGVPLVEALKSLAEVTHTVAHKHLYNKILEHITIGDSFSASFAAIKGSTRLLPVSVQQLIITGEQSGSLASTLLKIADIYDKKASNTAEKLPVVLEPMLLIFVGALVGTIAFAIITPIYSVVGSIGR